MSENSLIIDNDDAKNALIINDLHEHDQLFNSSAIRFGCFRSIFLSHFDDYLIKRSRANKRGLTKVIIGLRSMNRVVIYNRHTPHNIKEDVRSEIELFMTHMTNTILKMNESENEPQTLITCEHALVNLVNKFVYHEVVRQDILIKAKAIQECYTATTRKMGEYIFKKTGRKLSQIGKQLFIFDDDVINDLTGIEANELRRDVIINQRSKLTELLDLLELGSIEELTCQWSRVHSMLDNYRQFVKKRNEFVDTVNPLVRMMCNRALNKGRYFHDKQELKETLVHSCLKKLLANIFMYIPDNSYTTFAFPHITQEIKKELNQVGMIALPAKFKLMQGKVIEAGKDPVKVWCELRALEVLKRSEPSTDWTVELIMHCRFGNVISQSIHADNDDDDSFELSLTSNNNPEEELRNEQLKNMLTAELNKMPDDIRKGLLEYFSNSSDSFNVSKQSLVNNGDNGAVSNYRLKKVIQGLRDRFGDDYLNFYDSLI